MDRPAREAGSHGPTAIVPGHGLHRVIRDCDADFLARLGPPPNGIGLSALENHVVAEDGADKRRFKAALDGWWLVAVRTAGAAARTPTPRVKAAANPAGPLPPHIHEHHERRSRQVELVRRGLEFGECLGARQGSSQFRGR